MTKNNSKKQTKAELAMPRAINHSHPEEAEGQKACPLTDTDSPESKDDKIVKFKTERKRPPKKVDPGTRPLTKTKRKKTTKPKRSTKVTDELFLETIRNDVFKKLKSGEITPTLADAFKAIDLKNKLAKPESDNQLLELLEELRRELMRESNK